MKFYHSILILLLFSCEKQVTETIEVEKVTSWKPFSTISHEQKIIYNSETDSSNLYFYGENSFIKLNLTDPLFYIIGNRQSNSKPAMSARYSIDFTNYAYFKSGNTSRISNGIRVILNGNPLQSFSKDPTFSFQDFDSTFSPSTSIYVSNYFVYPIGFISSNDFFITVVNDPINSSRNAILICKIVVSVVDMFTKEINLVEKRVIDIPSEYDQWYATSFFYTGENFIVSSYHKAYVVDMESNLTIVLEKSLSDIILFDNKLYALSGNELLVSIDNGKNWASIGNNIPLNSHFFLVNKSLGFFVGQQIAILDLMTNQIIELKNDGLESNRIVSIKKYNNQVFVSTLSGVFYKNVNSFFERRSVAKLQ